MKSNGRDENSGRTLMSTGRESQRGECCMDAVTLHRTLNSLECPREGDNATDMTAWEATEHQILKMAITP